MPSIELCDDNFMIYAMKAYNKPGVIQSEFDEDLKRIKYIKRLLKRYKATGKLKERLILNHIIVLGNVFGVEATVTMLFFKLESEYYDSLKSFLLFLSYLPKVVDGIKNTHINTSEVPLDMVISGKLMEILKNT